MLVIAQPPRPFSAILGAGRSCMIFLKSYASHQAHTTHHAVQLALAHHHVGAQRLQTTEELAVLAASGHATPLHLHVLHDVDGLDAARLAQLDDTSADGGAGVVLEDDVTRLELCEGSEKFVCSAGVAEEVRGDLGGDSARDGEERVLGHHGSLRPRSYS